MKTDRDRRRVATLLALLAIVALPACSVFPGSEPADEETPSPEPTTSPAPPEMPKQATQKSVDGAVSFVEHYYKLVEYGHQTDDWKPLQQLSSSDCAECRKLWSNNQILEADEGVYTEVGTPDTMGIQDNQIEVTIIMEVGAGLDGNSSEVERFERIKKKWQDTVNVAYDDGWNVLDISPDQLRPNGCIADRCREHQKSSANGRNNG